MVARNVVVHVIRQDILFRSDPGSIPGTAIFLALLAFDAGRSSLHEEDNINYRICMS